MVLLPHGRSERTLLRADCLHDRRAASAEFIRGAFGATGQCVTHDRSLSRRPACSSGALPAISFSFIEVVGKHGRAAGCFSGRTDPGERRPVVPYGAGSAAFFVPGRCKTRRTPV